MADTRRVGERRGEHPGVHTRVGPQTAEATEWGSLGNLERTPDRVWPPATPPRSVVDAAAFDALDDPALQEEEVHHQWGDRDGRSHEQLVQVEALRREERRQRDLHRPGALVLPDDQRPQERVPGADERDRPDS